MASALRAAHRPVEGGENHLLAGSALSRCDIPPRPLRQAAGGNRQAEPCADACGEPPAPQSLRSSTMRTPLPSPTAAFGRIQWPARAACPQGPGAHRGRRSAPGPRLHFKRVALAAGSPPCCGCSVGQWLRSAGHVHRTRLRRTCISRRANLAGKGSIAGRRRRRSDPGPARVTLRAAAVAVDWPRVRDS
jgi:hypothetical protein